MNSREVSVSEKVNESQEVHEGGRVDRTSLKKSELSELW